MFFVGITVVLLLFMGFIALVVFLAKPQEKAPVLVFNKPKVTINVSVFNLDQFKNLQPFSEIETQYSYSATKNNKPAKGFITAVSKDKAVETLEKMGFVILKIQEAEIGRDNPFTPYFDISLEAALNNTTVSQTATTTSTTTK